MPRANRSPARARSVAAPAATSADHEDSDEVQEAVMKILEESLGSSAAEMQVEQQQGRLSPTRGRNGAVARFAPFLQEVRRRVKVEREALRALLRKPLPLPARLRSAGERVHRRRVAATQKAQQVKSQVVRRVRKSLTGAEDRRLRDLVRENTMRMRKALERPPVVRLRDKVSFLLGVLGCFVLEAAALLHPEHFWVCYSVYIVPLLLARVYYYKVLRWHYFLLDFCYASNLLCLAQIFVWPDSLTLFVINFAQTTGPLAMAIPTWRNSLVFHSLDKVTSAYIHALPPLLCFLMRWHPPAGWHGGWPAFSPALPEHLDVPWAVGCALGGYIAWQAAHLVLTELVFLPAPDSDTSIRTLTRPKPAQPPPGCYTGITKPVYVLCTQLGVMRKGELFDPEHWKTKLVFVSVQVRSRAISCDLVLGGEPQPRTPLRRHPHATPTLCLPQRPTLTQSSPPHWPPRSSSIRHSPSCLHATSGRRAGLTSST